jgi:tRNA nucleotidyltransferase (CCA-adding enzyme)
VLRVARFAARFADLGFRIAPETMLLMQDMAASGELSALTPERVWAETVKAFKTHQPQVYFDVLREVGALSVLFPALDRLFAVPQSPVHHPEGDAGVHTLLVLQAMRQETDDVGCLWAAVCHDLGKGLTPEHLLPRHPDHELAGVPLVVALNRHYKVPTAVAALAVLVTQWHGHIHRIDELSAQARLDVLNAVDVWRKPDRFMQLLAVCRADARGRLGYEQDAYPQWAQWQALLSAIGHISVSDLMAQGFSGKALGDQVARLRLAFIMGA